MCRPGLSNVPASNPHSTRLEHLESIPHRGRGGEQDTQSWNMPRCIKRVRETRAYLPMSRVLPNVLIGHSPLLRFPPTTPINGAAKTLMVTHALGSWLGEQLTWLLGVLRGRKTPGERVHTLQAARSSRTDRGFYAANVYKEPSTATHSR